MMRPFFLVIMYLFSWFVLADELSIAEPEDYLLSNHWQHAEIRMTLLELMRNEGTFALLEQLGIGPGMHCLDIGAGLGGVARWMKERVGSTGAVYALDKNTRFLQSPQASSLLVVEEDFTSEETALPKNYFDLIHIRNTLMHLPNKPAMIKKMTGLLKPGGVLVVEDMGIFNGDYQLSDLKTPEAAWKKEAGDYLALEKKQQNVISLRLPESPLVSTSRINTGAGKNTGRSGSWRQYCRTIYALFNSAAGARAEP